MKQTRQVVCAVKQSIFLRCLWLNTLGWKGLAWSPYQAHEHGLALDGDDDEPILSAAAVRVVGGKLLAAKKSRVFPEVIEVG